MKYYERKLENGSLLVRYNEETREANFVTAEVPIYFYLLGELEGFDNPETIAAKGYQECSSEHVAELLANALLQDALDDPDWE